MSLIISPDDTRITWQGAISLERTHHWIMPWRIPYEDRTLFPPDTLQERAAMPAGVRISFRSNTSILAGHIEPYPETTLQEYPTRYLDLFCNGHFQHSVDLARQHSFAFRNLCPEEKLIELWLPQHSEFRLKSLELSDEATIAPYNDIRPRWITYGSSITHCRSAEKPSLTWPAIVAREHGLNVTCLGYGGNCHLEPMIARMIRDLPADFISIKIGINVQGNSSLNARTFKPAVIGFVEIIREKHPYVPFVVVSPIYSPPRELIPNTVGLSLQDIREEVESAVKALQAHGDSNIYYVDGLKLFGSEYSNFLPDELHPDAEGYKLLGYNFLREVAIPLFI